MLLGAGRRRDGLVSRLLLPGQVSEGGGTDARSGAGSSPRRGGTGHAPTFSVEPPQLTEVGEDPCGSERPANSCPRGCRPPWGTDEPSGQGFPAPPLEGGQGRSPPCPRLSSSWRPALAPRSTSPQSRRGTGCTRVHMYVCTHVCVQGTCFWACTHMCRHARVYMCICAHVCRHACVYTCAPGATEAQRGSEGSISRP